MTEKEARAIVDKALKTTRKPLNTPLRELLERRGLSYRHGGLFAFLAPLAAAGTISVERAEQMVTLGDVVRYIQRL